MVVFALLIWVLPMFLLPVFCFSSDGGKDFFFLIVLPATIVMLLACGTLSFCAHQYSDSLSSSASAVKVTRM
jgi:hypothetical protein